VSEKGFTPAEHELIGRLDALRVSLELRGVIPGDAALTLLDAGQAVHDLAQLRNAASEKARSTEKRMTFDEWWNTTGADSFGLEGYYAAKEAWQTCREFGYSQAEKTAIFEKALEAFDKPSASTRLLPPIPAPIRREIERECDEAEHPKGMSVHDGRTRIKSDRVRMILARLDIYEGRRPWPEGVASDRDKTHG
jgi:hypothetical protein